MALDCIRLDKRTKLRTENNIFSPNPPCCIGGSVVGAKKTIAYFILFSEFLFLYCWYSSSFRILNKYVVQYNPACLTVSQILLSSMTSHFFRLRIPALGFLRIDERDACCKSERIFLASRPDSISISTMSLIF
jgi:hypothetical protein